MEYFYDENGKEPKYSLEDLIVFFNYKGYIYKWRFSIGVNFKFKKTKDFCYDILIDFIC